MIYAVYRLRADEIDMKLLENIKAAFINTKTELVNPSL